MISSDELAAPGGTVSEPEVIGIIPPVCVVAFISVCGNPVALTALLSREEEG